ncbi:GNAT family N-acetyltransferase [Luteibacter aegosomaticola]|uniref:GNAT family N-acetyltransferase n=1 Tax=Luteibacter aegosomaticola TaxID=2911538 RepID=UPI001FF952CE|nr:GNAT family N-acetyltransferase [Luteibacter aegosomaticola]UPG92218.1 GNAT family N-acetyltransferase [Luteibacter aegosomaticola]
MREKFLIRAGVPGDHDALLALWLRSVRATHTFLTAADIEALIPAVRDGALVALELSVLVAGDGALAGFMGLDGAKVEAIFIDPAHAGKGGGTALIAHARQVKGALAVDVNEQNPDALAFYLARGFVVVGRSETDGEGRPFPLLHLAEPTP